MVEAALVLCVISEVVVTAMLFTITLVEATAGSGGGAATEHEVVITSAVVVGPVDTCNRLQEGVQDVSPSPQEGPHEGPQEELMSVRSVVTAKETCAAAKGKKKSTLRELPTKSNTWPQSRTGEPEAGKMEGGLINY